jgi:protein AroM
MMAKLGIAVIGQAPRADIATLFAQILPGGTEIVLRGCLDEMSNVQIDELRPLSGADTLYTRLRGERDVKISKAAVIERAPETLRRLRADGVDAVLFACTGAFPPMPNDVGVVFPSRVLAAVAAGLLPHGRLGLLVPAPEQIEKLSEKWRRDGVEVVAEALIPSADEAATRAAAARLAGRELDLVAMDCMSYRPETKALVRQVVRAPALLAVTATARVLQELMT